MEDWRERLRNKKAVKQEKRLAKDIRGKRVVGSGNQPGHKGDVKDFTWLIECKYTDKMSYSLKLATWNKIKREAQQAGKEPALQIDLAGRRLVLIDLETWLMLKELIVD